MVHPLAGATTAEEAPRVLATTGEDDLPAGAVLAGRYELRHRLGAGGMGVVYRAHDRKLREDIALKVIRPDRLADARAVDRLHREAKLARRIGHANVCRVFDSGESDGVHFLTMERIDGRLLREQIVAGGLPLAAALAILVQIGRALVAAHAEGIVHRDLKPENVIVRADGQVKVLDFGIARRADAAPGDSVVVGSLAGTLERGLVGTPLYMAPEQISGGPLDGRTDEFAWGVLAYELLTGHPPWTREAVPVPNRILADDPAPIRRARPDVPPALAAVVQRALAHRPEDRFPTVADLLAALEPLAAAAPTRPHRRRPLALAAATAALTAAGVTVALLAAAPATDAPVAHRPADAARRSPPTAAGSPS